MADSSHNRRGFFRINTSVSIWLTTITIIVLILLLAITINRSREKELVRDFCHQQTALAKGAAAGIEDLVIGVEKSMILLSRLTINREDINKEKTLTSMRAIYDDLEGKVSFIAATDRKGIVLAGYPEDSLEAIKDRDFSQYPFFQEIRKTRKPDIGPSPALVDQQESMPAAGLRSIIVGAPQLVSGREFSGVIFTTLSLSTTIDRYVKPIKENPTNEYWVLDDVGIIVEHPKMAMIGKNINAIEFYGETGRLQIESIMKNGQEGCIECKMNKDGGVYEKNLFAYAPIHVGHETWYIVVVTPYEKVVAMMRKTFNHTMIITFGLIIVVIIASFTIINAGRRRTKIDAELKRLRERESWQEQLIREKKTIEGIIEGSPIPTFVIDKEHKVILWNRACAELTGVGSNEVFGTDRHHIPFYGQQKRPLIADLIIDQDVDGLEKFYSDKKVKKSDKVRGAYEARDYYENLGGKRRYLYFLAAPILDEKGEIIAAIETLQDMSKEEEMSQRLRDWQEQLLREKKTIEGIIEGSPIPTFVVNKEHKVILWNRACAELTGLEAADMINTDKQYLPFYTEKRPVIADLIIDQDIEGLTKFYGTKRVKQSETVEGAYEAMDFYRNLGGKPRHLFFLASPIYDEKGEIVAAIETLQDVSKEKEMARNLQEYAETLENEVTENVTLRKEIESLYNYLQSIVESSPDTLFDISSNGIINYISRDFKGTKRLASDQIKGKHFTEVIDQEHRDVIISMWENARKGVYKPYEIEIKKDDHTVMNLLVTCRPVAKTDRYVVVQRDITEFKNLENKFYESQKLAAIGQLSAGIAHEIRNPLSSIKMSLQILAKRMQPTGNDQKRFQIAQREVEHLEELVNDVLIYAKPSNPVKEKSNIQSILEHALAMAEKSILDKHIQVKMGGADMPPVTVDAAMIGQAFLNLFRNAIDAMDMEGTLTVHAEHSESDGTVRITVQDNGCGIDEQDLSHIFNPFFTKKSYGTGLGLSQVKKIIDLHQGSIEITSQKGVGTGVIVTIPTEPTPQQG